MRLGLGQMVLVLHDRMQMRVQCRLVKMLHAVMVEWLLVCAHRCWILIEGNGRLNAVDETLVALLVSA